MQDLLVGRDDISCAEILYAGDLSMCEIIDMKKRRLRPDGATRPRQPFSFSIP
jgi:hypothetical protein